MLKLSCLCGHVRVTVARSPDHINECNCTLCSKTGARWGYFAPAAVAVEGTTSGYSRADKVDPAAEVRFCATCGATTHFVLTAAAIERFGDTLVGVNMRLASNEELTGIELRFPDGRAWSGDGAFSYVRAAEIIGSAAPAGD